MASSVRWCAPRGVFPSIFGRFLSLLVLGSKVRLLGEPRCMGTSPHENSQLCQVITLLPEHLGSPPTWLPTRNRALFPLVRDSASGMLRLLRTRCFVFRHVTPANCRQLSALFPPPVGEAWISSLAGCMTRWACKTSACLVQGVRRNRSFCVRIWVLGRILAQSLPFLGVYAFRGSP